MFIQKANESQGEEKDKGFSQKHGLEAELKEHGLKEDLTFIKEMINPERKRDKHEYASERLFEHLVEKNGLEIEMKKYGLLEGGGEENKEEEEEEEGGGRGAVGGKGRGGAAAGADKWLFKGRGEEKSFLYEIVANKLNGIDVDKFDYLDRDCHHLGLKNTFDYRRFFLLARVCEVNGRKHICLREKDMGNLYDMFYSRYSLHRRVYQHKVTKNVEMMITDAFRSADPVLKLSEAIKEENIEDYIKLTDDVFGKILHSTDEDNMVEARELLQNIHKRNLYKFVGEAKDISDEEKQPLITELEKDLLSAGSLEVHTFKFDYGKGDKDPLDKTYFYRKDNRKRGFPIPSKERSTLLPKHFCEKRFRVYWKNTENTVEAEEKLKRVMERFSTRFHPDSVGAQREDGNNEEQN